MHRQPPATPACLPPAPPAVAKEKDLLRVPPDSVPLEQAAMLREALAAYRLLEDHGALKVHSCRAAAARPGARTP